MCEDMESNVFTVQSIDFENIDDPVGDLEDEEFAAIRAKTLDCCLRLQSDKVVERCTVAIEQVSIELKNVYKSIAVLAIVFMIVMLWAIAILGF